MNRFAALEEPGDKPQRKNRFDELENPPEYQGWGEYVGDLARTAAQGASIGTSDEIVAGVRSVLPESLGGADYSTALGQEREAVGRFRKHNPATALTAEIAAGLVVPMAGAGFIARGAGMAGRSLRSAGVGAGYAGAYGFGSGEGGVEKRLENAAQSAPFGAVLGGAAPAVISGVTSAAGRATETLSPLVARASGAVAERMAGRKPISGGAAAAADSGVPFAAPGMAADRAATQIIANQLTRSGAWSGRLSRQVDDADDATKFWSSGNARNDLAVADLDEGLARLGGAVGRQQPIAYSRSKAFLDARQTGYADGMLPPNSGLELAERMSVDTTSRRTAGQFERIRDALRRSLRISDKDHHGHQKNAFRTLQAIEDRAKAQADTDYSAWRSAGAAPDAKAELAQATNGLVQRWGAAMDDVPEPVQKELAKAVQLIATAQGNHARLHNVKMFLDARIDSLAKGGEAPASNRFTAGRLTEVVRDLVGTIEGTSTGAMYAKARGNFSAAKRSQDALERGRQVFKEDSDVLVDEMQGLSAEDRKLFLLGLLESFEGVMARRSRTNDMTKLFESPRVQQILAEAIPRSKSRLDRFADNPERLGRFLDNESQMYATRNTVLGGSQTAKNLADDAQYDGLQQTVEAFMQSPGLIQLGIKAAQRMLNNLFGFRADTAEAIANKLFTANPAERARVIAEIERAMARDRMELFETYMQRIGQQTPRGAGVTVGAERE